MPLITVPSSAQLTRAILAGHRGQIEWDYQLWSSNIRSEKVAQIDSVESGQVTLSNFRDHTWELGVNLNEDQLIDPFLDYVKLVIRLRTALDEWIEYPFGLYRFESPKGSDNPFYTAWDLTGQSPEVTLMDRMADTGYKAVAGIGCLFHVRTILTQQGVPAEMINFPSADSNLTTTMIFSPFQDVDSCWWLRICNAILAAGGYYALWTDAQGRFTTRDLDAARTPTVTYLGNGEPGDVGEELITGDIGWEYGREFFNKVIVYSGNTAQAPPIVGVAELHRQPMAAPNSYTQIVVDPESPYSYEALGGRFLTRPPETLDTINSTTTAKALAKNLLRTTATRHATISVSTMPDPRRGPREDYHIKARRTDGDVLYDGVYRCVNWTLPLDLGEMSHELSKTVTDV